MLVETASRADEGLVDRLTAELCLGGVSTVAFVVLGELERTLPLYLTAIATARRGWALGIDHARYWLVTPEPVPVEAYGSVASAAVAMRLEPEGIAFIGSTFADVRPGIVLLDPRGGCLEADRIVTLAQEHRRD